MTKEIPGHAIRQNRSQESGEAGAGKAKQPAGPAFERLPEQSAAAEPAFKQLPEQSVQAAVPARPDPSGEVIPAPRCAGLHDRGLCRSSSRRCGHPAHYRGEPARGRD